MHPQAKARVLNLDLTHTEGILYINTMHARNLRAIWWTPTNIPNFRRVYRETIEDFMDRMGLTEANANGHW